MSMEAILTAYNVCTSDGLSDPIATLSSGVLQGGILSPYLFVIAMDSYILCNATTYG